MTRSAFRAVGPASTTHATRTLESDAGTGIKWRVGTTAYSAYAPDVAKSPSTPTIEVHNRSSPERHSSQIPQPSKMVAVTLEPSHRSSADAPTATTVRKPRVTAARAITAGKMAFSIPDSASLAEVVARFGSGTAQRIVVTDRLRRIYQLGVATGQLDRLVVFGSYVSDVDEPNDIDVILVMRSEFRPADCPSESLVLFDHGRANDELGASLFWVRPDMLLGRAGVAISLDQPRNYAQRSWRKPIRSTSWCGPPPSCPLYGQALILLGPR